MQERIVITEAAAAAVFASASQRNIVETLMEAPLSLAALARVTHKPLSLLHYHVEKWLRLGLVEIVDVQPRAGRPVKRYQATARSFFVPADRMRELPGAGLGLLLRDALDRHRRASSAGRASSPYRWQGPRTIVHRDVPDRSVALERWLDIGLASADADSTFEDLSAVIDRYRTRVSDTRPRYLVHWRPRGSNFTPPPRARRRGVSDRHRVPDRAARSPPPLTAARQADDLVDGDRGGRQQRSISARSASPASARHRLGQGVASAAEAQAQLRCLCPAQTPTAPPAHRPPICTSVAPSRISRLQPCARGSSGEPGTAITSRPASAATPRGDQRPRFRRAFHHQSPRRQPGDDAVAAREMARLRLHAGLLFGQ